MNFIHNIKYNYYKKVINDLIVEKKYDELKKELLKIYNKSPTLYYLYLKDFYQSYREINNTNNLFFNNFVYINSFLETDIEIVNNFLKFYFKELNYKQINFGSLSSNVAAVCQKLKKNEFLNFDLMVKNLIFFQTIISCSKPELLNIISNQHAFFSTQENLNFSDPNLVKCFFLVVDHPYTLYQRLKKKFENKIDLQNYIFNFDKKPLLEEHNQIKIEILRKDWETFNSSWLDPNVINSFKGLIIKKDELTNKITCQDTYSSIILHLKQSGLDIPIKYDVISKYISTLSFIGDQFDELSNNEKKFIKNNIGNIYSELDFEV